MDGISGKAQIWSEAHSGIQGGRIGFLGAATWKMETWEERSISSKLRFGLGGIDVGSPFVGLHIHCVPCVSLFPSPFSLHPL